MTSRKQASNKVQQQTRESGQQGQSTRSKGSSGSPAVKKDEFEKRRQELLDETQRYMYQQSSKFSSVS